LDFPLYLQQKFIEPKSVMGHCHHFCLYFEYEFHYKSESADLEGKWRAGSMYYLAPGGTAMQVINPGNASVMAGSVNMPVQQNLM